MAAATQDESSRVTLEAWLETDIGMVRDHNEDSAYMEPERGFFIVADGMGGHAAGEVASAMAVETVKNTLESSRDEIEAFTRAPTDLGRRGLVQLLQNAVLAAHQAVYQRGQAEADKAGMGTTLDVVLVAGPEAFVAHVGDSRTYLIRDGKVSQITTDHTVAEVLVIEGKLTIEEAQVSPLRTILVNAIGVSADVGVEMAHVTLKKGDRLLLCSDGLHDYFPMEDEIAQRLSTDTPGAALAEMVELAKTRGGHDNITGVTVQILDVGEAAPDEVDADSTQPVDGSNPFADEPTETSVITPMTGIPPRMVSTVIPHGNLRQMNPIDELDDTLPPPNRVEPGDKDVAWDGPTDAKAAHLPPDDEAESERQKTEPDGEPADSDADAKPKAAKSKSTKKTKAKEKPDADPATTPSPDRDDDKDD